MVAIAVEDCEGPALQILTDEDSLDARGLVERVQEPAAGIVAACHAQQRVGLADDMVRRNQHKRPRDQSSEDARGLLVTGIVDDLSGKPRSGVDKDSPKRHRRPLRARSDAASTRSWRSETSGRR